MPDGKHKRRIFDYRTQIAAYRFLIQMKRGRLVYAAQWAKIHQSELWSRRLQQKIKELEQAQRDIIVVAVTGIASVAGAYLLTAQLARAGQFAYRTGQLARTVTGVREVTTVTGQAMRLASLPRFSFLRWAGAKILTIPVSALGAFVSSAVTGTTAFGLVARFYQGIGAKPLSEEELKQLREMLTAEGIGDAEFQAIVQNPNCPQQRLQQALQRTVNDKIAQHMSERLQQLAQPLPGLLLMSDAELARWYRQFRLDAERIYNEAELECSDDERVMLKQIGLMDFWIYTMRALDQMESNLRRDINILENAIKEEETTIRFNQLNRAMQDKARRGD